LKNIVIHTDRVKFNAFDDNLFPQIKSLLIVELEQY